MNIEFSSHFLRQARKLSKQDQKKLSERIEWLREDTNNPKLKLHQLTGKLKGIWAMSVTHSIRALFSFEKSGTVLFFDVGSHDEVYR